ncbi:LysR substrate-binding domain-containing protein [Paraburkholderia caffeinilytica]
MPRSRSKIVMDYGLSDIVADRFDIGVRWGDQVAKDMIAVRIGPDVRLVIVASPGYLSKRTAPRQPKDLLQHNCITLRLPTHGGLYAWELKKGKKEVQVRVDGQFTFNGTYQMLNAAIDDAGLAFVPEDLAAPHIAAGRLKYVLEDWFPTFPGPHIFYATRREFSRALAVVVDALRVDGRENG